MPISTNSGQMRKVIRVEQRSSNPDSAGEPQFTWALVTQQRAAIIRMPGTERKVGEGRMPRVPTTFVTRYPRSLTIKPQMRLTCDGVLYDIVSAVDPDGMKAELNITCLELTNEPTV